MKFAFWPGCSVPRQGTPELRITAAAVCDKLGIELEDLSLAPCTGSGILQGRDLVYADTLNASTFAMVEEMGLPLMTICSTCQGVFSQAQKRLKEKPDYLAQINETLAEQGMEYSGNVEVKHLLWVLVEDYGLGELRKAVMKPLASLRVAPFYGCYLLRPSAALGFDEHPERKKALESLIATLGAEAVDFRGKSLCCGYPLVGVNDENSAAMVGTHTLEAKEKGADCMVTPCPLCHMNLDGVQPQAGEQRGTKINMPVLHLSQLIGLALGIDPPDLGFERHAVSVKSVLDKLGL
ncbi:MAG: CoB--CoM heterodisulfide reductase iron-sulfur subunit B family protein [Dehalococcoidia bacterium]